MKNIYLTSLISSMALMTFMTVVPISPVSAANIAVTTTSGGIGPPDCTLRDAITAANTDTATGGCPAGSGDDIINLLPGTYTLTTVHGFKTGLPIITTRITINGNGDTIQRISAAAFRIFKIGSTGDLTVNGVTVTGGETDTSDASGPTGGGFQNFGTLHLMNSTVIGNTAFTEGGGIGNFAGGTLTITNSTVSGNEANRGGAIATGVGTDLTLTNSTVSGNSAVMRMIAGAPRRGEGGGIRVDFGNTTLNHSTVSGNMATGADAVDGDAVGGGIFLRAGVLTLTHSIVTLNMSDGSGGGIGNMDDLTLQETTVSGNMAGTVGGGISNVIFLGSIARLINSTVSGNSADEGGGISNISNLTLTNSTVSGNTAVTNFGGIANIGVPGGSTTLTNSTVTDNVTTSGSVGGINETLTSKNSIIAGNSPSDCTGENIFSLGNNIDSDDTCKLTIATDQVNVNPLLLLAPLADNGGPTETHALVPSSPAIDAGDNTSCPATDQRGFVRPVDGDESGMSTCDIGAFEVQLERVVNNNPGADGQVTTDIEGDGATPTDPVETTVTTPNDGTVEIVESDITPGATPGATGFQVLGLQVDITAPPASIGDPITIVFVLDASIIPPGEDHTTIQVFKDGVVVAACTGAPSAIPDPCVSNRALLAGGDVQITVLTSTASLWGLLVPVHPPPVAQCQNVTVSANASCQASASVDDGSFHPDGDPFTLTQNPPGPYILGDTPVTLTVTEALLGASDQCTATVTVVDDTQPTITCAADQMVECGASASYIPTASDNCPAGPATATSCVPASGSTFLETDTVTCTATDGSGNQDTCETTVTVVDTTAPDVSCNSPDTIVPSDAPVSFTATAADICGDVTIVITEFDCFRIKKKGDRVDKTASCIVSFADDTITISDSGGTGDTIEWTVRATDASGNSNEVTCGLEVVKKK